MAYTTINKPNTQMNTVLYTGNGGTQSITGVGFQPDWTWLKARNEAASHELFDANRGVTKTINSNTNNAEATQTDSLTAFGSDGFTLGSNGDINYNNSTYVGWNWKAGGTASSNTDGSITSSVSANTTSGFSVVTFTGTGSNATIGHGLGVKPDAVFFKRLDTTGGWASYHSVLGATKYMRLDTNSGEQTASDEFQNTEPTSSVISIGTDGAVNGTSMVAYCFADVKGFSKFNSYVGNGSTDGPFIFTGFKPAFVLIKKSNASGTDWQLTDNKRDLHNVCTHRLLPNDSIAEQTDSLDLDILSNGFKIRKSSTTSNASGATYIYLAFAENPLVGTNNVPATAR